MRDETVKVSESHLNVLRASAEAVPELERRALVAGMMRSAAAPRPFVRDSVPPASRAKRKATRKAQRAARRNNRRSR